MQNFKNFFESGKPEQITHDELMTMDSFIYNMGDTFYWHEWMISDARRELKTGKHQYRVVHLKRASKYSIKFMCGGCEANYYVDREAFWYGSTFFNSPAKEIHVQLSEPLKLQDGLFAAIDREITRAGIRGDLLTKRRGW